MPISATVYDTADGARWSTLEAAERHEAMLKAAESIMALFGIRTPEGGTYIQHKKGNVAMAQTEFVLRIGVEACSRISELLAKVTAGEHVHPSHLDYWLCESLHGGVLRAWNRLACMDPDTDREYEQRYFRNNPWKTREALPSELRDFR